MLLRLAGARCLSGVDADPFDDALILTPGTRENLRKISRSAANLVLVRTTFTFLCYMGSIVDMIPGLDG